MNRSVFFLPGCILLVLFVGIMASPAVESAPSDMLSEPKLEARARALAKDIRCLVCQNQSIDDSDADLARDLRLLVRERLLAGDSDDQVRDYLVARYGAYVLMTPPWGPATLLLWLGPGLIFLIGASLIVLRVFRSGRRTGPETGAADADGRP